MVERPATVEIEHVTWEKLRDALADFRDAGRDPGTLATTLLYVIHDAISNRAPRPDEQAESRP